MKFEGIYTPAITPHAPDGAIDREAFAEVLELLIAAGVHGIIVGGSTGEYYAHSPQERFDLAAQAREVIGGRVPLIVGTGAIRTEELGRLCEGREGDQGGRHPRHLAPLRDPDRARECRARADHRPGGRPADHALQLSGPDGRLDGRGVFLPRRPVEECGRDQGKLGRHGPGAHAGAEVPEHRAQLRLGRPGARVLRLGARSWVCAGSNFIPKEHIALYEACAVERNFDKGRRIMMAMMPLMSFLDGGKFVQSIKHGCELAGLKAGTPAGAAAAASKRTTSAGSRPSSPR